MYLLETEIDSWVSLIMPSQMNMKGMGEGGGKTYKSPALTSQFSWEHWEWTLGGVHSH